MAQAVAWRQRKKIAKYRSRRNADSAIEQRFERDFAEGSCGRESFRNWGARPSSSYVDAIVRMLYRAGYL